MRFYISGTLAGTLKDDLVRKKARKVDRHENAVLETDRMLHRPYRVAVLFRNAAILCGPSSCGDVDDAFGRAANRDGKAYSGGKAYSN